MLSSSIITWASIHEHGRLWFDHLCLRKKLFVDQMGWDIPHALGAEWDQYDTPSTIYIVTHNNGTVVAASRLNPCAFESPIGSYMIRDAARGRLPGIPAEILTNEQAPTDPNTWEATRFTVDPDLDAAARNEALSQNARDLAATAQDAGATRIIALMPPAYIRWLSSLGLKTNRFGPTQKDGAGDRCCVMEMSLSQKVL